MIRIGYDNLKFSDTSKVYLGSKLIYFKKHEFHPITQNVINYADSLSITKPNLSTLISVDRLLRDCIASDYFTVSDIFMPFAYNDVTVSEFAKICWKRITKITSLGNTIYTVNGWETGSNLQDHFDLEYSLGVDNVNYLENDASVSCVLYADNDSPAYSTIVRDENRYIFFNADSNISNINTLNTAPNSNLSGSGFKCLSRNNSNDQDITDKNETETLIVSSTTMPANEPVYFLKQFSRGSRLGASSLMLGGSITFAQAQQFRTDYNKYLTAIGLTPFA